MIFIITLIYLLLFNLFLMKFLIFGFVKLRFGILILFLRFLMPLLFVVSLIPRWCLLIHKILLDGNQLKKAYAPPKKLFFILVNNCRFRSTIREAEVSLKKLYKSLIEFGSTKYSHPV